MKFVTSLLVFITLPVLAAPIRIYHEKEEDRARIVKDIFLQQYLVPEDLIMMSEVQNCGDIKGRGKLDLCLKNNGDLLAVSVDRGFVNDSLKIFQAP